MLAIREIFILFLIPSNFGEYLTENDLDGLIKLVLSDYDKSIRAGNDEQLKVTINFYVHGLSAIDEVNMDYELNEFFRQVTFVELTPMYRC